MAQKKSNKIKKYRKPLNINLGIIIFSVIFIYIIICVVMFFNSKHIVGYEVNIGSLSISKVYQGIAQREEVVFQSNANGYINYYAKEGAKIAYNQLVYTVDETGKLNELAQENQDKITLNDDDLNELKNQIVLFKNEFEQEDFSGVYDFKDEVNGTILKLANANVLANLSTLDGASESLILYGLSEQSGVISYQVDGLENVTDDLLTPELFDKSNYEKNQLINNDLVTTEDPVYKLCMSEDWSIIIQVDAARGAELLEQEYVKVKFLETQDISWGKVDLITNGDNTYVKLTFTNSMITYCTERFIDIELVTNDKLGLKIPNSSIVEKEFFLVPTEYLVTTGNTKDSGFMKTAYDEDGNETTEFIKTAIYNETDTEYYVDDSSLRVGDQIRKPDSMETYTISKRGTLIGVYNMNKGYADFKQINILYQNEEYSIVESNTNYGLSVYDHIVLESESVNENDFIYE